MFGLKIFVFLILKIKCFDSLLVSFDEYEDYSRFGINSFECGLRTAPIITNITFSPNCFYKKYPNISVSIFYDFIKIDEIRSRVINGVEAEEGEAPWIVLLHNEHGKGSMCAGVLITFQWLVTAAHCQEDLQGNDSKIYAGSNIAFSGIIKLGRDAKWFPHPGFNKDDGKTYANDIALIKLSTKFEKRTNDRIYLINTICLPKAYKNLEANSVERATFFGWGLTESKEAASKLLKGELTLALNAFCRRHRYDSLCILYDSDYTGPKIGDGDSGGPLVQYDIVNKTSRAILAGISSGAERPSPIIRENNFWPALPPFMYWILKTIEDNE